MTSLPTRARLLVCLAASFSLLAPPAARAAKSSAPDHWVGTWAAAPLGRENDTSFGAADTTLRQIVHTSLAGPLVRVELTNEFGTEPLVVAAVHLALANGKAGDITLASANALTFDGKESVTIPAGAMALSDPAALAVPAGADLAVSIFLPMQKISHVTYHGSAFQTNYFVPGNLVGAKTLSAASPKTTGSWFFLKAIDVKTAADTAAVVAFGDSITDGSSSTKDTNQRWPDVLARRLQAGKKTRTLGVLNEGIGGNRVLHDGAGQSALARFDRDVLGQSGVRYLVLLESINDIGTSHDPKGPHEVVTADDLIQGLSQLTERAHAHGIKVIGATLTPYLGAGYSSPEGEAMRQAVNTWIRTNKMLDGMVDFDKATRDPAHPDTFSPAGDSGDHLHPNDAGLKMMGDAFDLKLFTPNR